LLDVEPATLPENMRVARLFASSTICAFTVSFVSPLFPALASLIFSMGRYDRPMIISKTWSLLR